MSSFKLNSGDREFRDRQKKVFDQLKEVEIARSNPDFVVNMDIARDRTKSEHKRTHRSETKHFRGKESIFKKPQNPTPKMYINKIPDFKKNPHKWTKYSLEDVQDVTDESNRKSAMDFLKELANRRKRERGEEIEETLTELPTKIVFNKHPRKCTTQRPQIVREPVDSTVNDDAEREKRETQRTLSGSSKIVMPEYVVGQKVARKSKKEKKQVDGIEKSKELKLDHLMFEDE